LYNKPLRLPRSVDDSFRVRFIYNSYKSNNIKDKYLHKFDYISKDSLLYSVYSYNWSNKSDSLVYQTRVVNNNGTTQYENLYGLRVSGILGNNLCSQAQLVAASVSGAFGVLGSLGIGYLGATVINPTVGALAGIGLFVIWFSNGACGQDLIQNTNSNYPNNPISENIPNPMGTPNFPNGYNDSISIEISRGGVNDPCCFVSGVVSLNIENVGIFTYNYQSSTTIYPRKYFKVLLPDIATKNYNATVTHIETSNMAGCMLDIKSANGVFKLSQNSFPNLVLNTPVINTFVITH
jgi:hypothetical protein